MSHAPVEHRELSTIRLHSENGSRAGRAVLIPAVRLSMYYCNLFIP